MKKCPDRGKDAATPEYSSPPCYAHEFPGYFGETEGFGSEELVSRLNALLEAERAGAKVLAALLPPLQHDSEQWVQLDRIRRDEGANAALLHRAILALGGTPSSDTGAFHDKAMAVPGLTDRLIFINKGQSWVVRKIDELLPALPQGPVLEMLQGMRSSHLANIDACEHLLGKCFGYQSPPEEK